MSPLYVLIFAVWSSTGYAGGPAVAYFESAAACEIVAQTIELRRYSEIIVRCAVDVGEGH